MEESILQKIKNKFLSYFLNSKDEVLVVDLGTVNTLIFHSGISKFFKKPTVVALNKDINKIVAIGDQAKIMEGKTPDNIKIIRPLEYGVIQDFDITKRFLNIFIKEIIKDKHLFFKKYRAITSAPPFTSEVELKALEDVFLELEFREVYISKETTLAAIGMGLDVLKSKANFIIDVGGGTTNIALISSGDHIIEKSLKIGGRKFDQDIKEYIEEKFDLIIGLNSAEKIKTKIGTCIDLGKRTEFKVIGKFKESYLPGEITINDSHIMTALKDSIEYIISEIKDAVKEVPPELTDDLLKNGIYLTGGASLLKGLKILIERATGIKVNHDKKPFTAIIRGGATVLKNLKKWLPIFYEKEKF